jgi:AraC-like DNA-binding protein/ligand-binding sensor protein
MNTNKTLVDQLASSELYREYEQAFSTATGMPVALRPLETFDLPFHGKKQENAFCAMMARKNRTCSSCLQMQEELRRNATEKPATATCAHGLCEAAVPVRLGDKLIAFLQTGQVLAEKPSPERVEKVVARARSMGIEESSKAIEEAYLKTPVVPRAKFNSTLRLLTIFADLLSIRSNQIAVRQANSEHPIVTKAKQYIEQQHAEEISLGQVAEAVHVSPFHLCKLFRKSTGMTFTEFVSRTRTEKAKNLLLNPQLRISEIVYEVGFQSLTHFNRIFKKLVGQSPTQYRARTANAGEPMSLAHCHRRNRGANVLAAFA